MNFENMSFMKSIKIRRLKIEVKDMFSFFAWRNVFVYPEFVQRRNNRCHIQGAKKENSDILKV